MASTVSPNQRPPSYFVSGLGDRYLIYDPQEGCPHPQWEHGIAVVALMVLNREAIEKRELPVGARSQKDVEDLGWVCLEPGMAAFIREVASDDDDRRDGDACDDDIQGWATDLGFLHKDANIDNNTLYERLKQVSDDALGPEHDHTGSPPISAKHPQGGVALERLLCRVSGSPNNAQGRRCYSLGYSYERPRSVIHPCRNMKYNEDIPKDEDFRTRLLEVATECGGHAMSLAPKKRIDLIENIGIIKNTPPLGHESNRRYWTGFQANVSRPIPHQTASDFQEDLGRAGDAHPDSHDQIGSFSALIVATETPEGYTTANFHLIELGVFIPMIFGTIIIFSGLRLHARAPSMAMNPIAKIPEHIYSIALVLYLTKEHTNPRNVRLQFASSIADKKHPDLTILPPEAYSEDSRYRSIPSSSPATMLRDGHMVAGDRLPSHSMDSLAALLNHLTLDSPEYSFRFTGASLANAVEVTRRHDGTLVNVEVPVLDPSWVQQVFDEWDDLVNTQRYILGGVTTMKAKLPSRDKLSKLGSARERLRVPDPDEPVPSTSRVGDPIERESTHLERETPNGGDLTPEEEWDSILGKRNRTAEFDEAYSEDGNEGEEEQDGSDISNNGESGNLTKKPKKKKRTDKPEKDAKGKRKGKKNDSRKNKRDKKDRKGELLKIFDPDYIKSIVEKLKATLPAKPKSNCFNYGQVKDNVSCSINLIDLACKTVAKPANIEHALNVPMVWTYIGKGYSNLQGLDLTTILIRYSIMLAVWRVWAVLEVDCRRLVQDTLNDAPANWLSPLVIKIRDHLLFQRTDTIILQSTEFLPGVKKNIKFSLKPTKGTWTENHLPEDLVIDNVLNVLGLWLECPREIGKNALWRDQGHLVEVLVAHSGGNYICFLEETWNAFQNPKLLIGQRQNGTAKKNHWTALSADIESCMRDRGRKEIIEEFHKLNDILIPFVGKAEGIHNSRS
ncbi:hypothetical protein NEOLEDRAFT_1149589 [Neolentinus lepideus HHB14362 ss-1]|uniref:Uncharacterized protein n=1 Tax=Neolentinus lepideus HHB14362 ss-1 TaxID=1314782 RepID=A0A165R0N4_9AGAM|nr:hypothetical protein NEOLEDRAFT_1149589 [Neolentinus lepideus HHB14362 ss-1]